MTSEQNADFSADTFVKGLFITTDKIPYASVETENRIETYPVYSDEMRYRIMEVVYRTTKKVPNKNQKEQIQNALATQALLGGEKKAVWIRTAKAGEHIEVDLNNAAGECVHITETGWKIENPTSVFYRPNFQQEMVQPQKGASWEIFKKHFKTKSEEDLKLIIGFMTSCFKPIGPYAVLVLQGEQGSAKSTTAQMIKMLVDPSMGATRSLARKEHDLFIAAKNNHLISFDNISLIKNDISDTLCRLATGGSFSCRSLYTNDGELLLELCKPILLNGITDFINRADLGSRSLIVELAPIPETERKTREAVMAAFEADLPLMLGVLMDGVASALKNQGKATLERMPRLADMTKWCTAAEEGLGWPANTFLQALDNNQLNAVLVNLSVDPVAIALRSFMKAQQSGRWKGSATELLTALNAHRPYAETARSWPATPNYLSQYLSRMAPSLRKVGVDFVGKDRTSEQRLLILEKLPNFAEMHSEAAEEAETSRLIPRTPAIFDDEDGWFLPEDSDGHDTNDGKRA